jgi:hypothetical protein
MTKVVEGWLPNCHPVTEWQRGPTRSTYRLSLHSVARTAFLTSIIHAMTCWNIYNSRQDTDEFYLAPLTAGGSNWNVTLSPAPSPRHLCQLYANTQQSSGGHVPRPNEFDQIYTGIIRLLRGGISLLLQYNKARRCSRRLSYQILQAPNNIT